MRVTYFHQHFSTRDGQAGTRSYEFAKYLVEKGDSVDMICGRNQKSNFDLAAKGRCQIVDIDGITVHVINVPYSPKMSFLSRVWAFLFFSFWATIEGLKCAKPNVIFATSTPITIAIPGLLVSWLRRKPLVFEVRDIWPESAIATGVLKNKAIIYFAEIFERLIYRRSKRVVCFSHKMREQIVEATGFSESKFRVIQIGADLDLFGGDEPDLSFRREHKLENKFLAVFPGAHGVANGLDLLVEASSLLPEDICIVMIGDGAQKAALQQKAAALGTKSMVFMDPIPKVRLAKILPTMDCGLMILRPLKLFEGALPNKFFDYISSGLPVIVNFPGEIADLLEDSNAGLCIEERTPASIANAIIKLKSEPGLSDTMSKNARTLAEGFDRQKLAATFRETLHEVSGSIST